MFNNLLKTHNFTDAYRWANPHNDENRNTFWMPYGNARDRNIGCRLDMFLIQDNSMCINEVEHLNDYYGSDHCPILLDIIIKSIE